VKNLPTTILLVNLLTLSIPSASSGQGPAKEHFGKPQASWLERLQSKDALERDEAIQVFARVGTEGRDAAPLLRSLLKNPALTTRLQAALALWKVQEDGKDSAPTLAEDFAAMSQAQKSQVVSFVLGLKKADEPSFVMLDAIRKDPQFVNHVQFHLSSLAPEAVPLYRKWIEASKGKERAATIAATPIAYLILSKGEIVAPYLKDADPVCQAAAAAALLAISEKREAAVAALIALAESTEQEVRNRALWALCHHRPPSRKAAAVYLQGLKHPSFDYRLAAVQPVLAVAPDNAKDVLPILEEGLNNPSFQVRFRVYPLVMELKEKGEKLVPLLLAKLKDPALGGEAFSVLGALAPQAERVGKEVGDIVFADPSRANRLLAPALSPFVRHFLNTLVKHLEGEDAARKKLAVIVAQWAPPDSAEKLIPRLTPLLKDETYTEAALLALEAQGARAAVPEVFALLEGKPTPNRVAAIQRTLLRLRPEPKVLDRLLDRLKDKTEISPEQRILAAELALLHPERRKEAADFLGPLVAGKDFDRSFALQRTLEKLGPDAVKLLPQMHKRLKEQHGALIHLDRVLIRMGPAAREVVPTLLEQAEKQGNYSELLRTARVIVALDPAKRQPVEERLSKLFLERLEKYPTGDELNWDFFQLLELCKEPHGPTKTLAPLLRKVFRDSPREEIRADLAAPLSRIDPDFAPEVLHTLENRLGVFPQCREWAMLGLLRLNPEHPRALAELKKYLEDANQSYRLLAVRVAMRCEKPLPGVRERIEATLKNPPNDSFKFSAYLTLMRYDGKLNPAWVDEILAQWERSVLILRDLPTLGAIGKPLIPRLRALAADEDRLRYCEEIIDQLERSR